MDLDLKVLLIEDDEDTAMAITEALEGSRHKVTAVRSVAAVKDGLLDAVDWSNKPVEIGLNAFQLALVDGHLPGRHQGWDVVPTLVKVGIVCVGISSSRDKHGQLIAAGAENLPYAGAMLDWGTISRWIEHQLLPQGKLYRQSSPAA